MDSKFWMKSKYSTRLENHTGTGEPPTRFFWRTPNQTSKQRTIQELSICLIRGERERQQLMKVRTFRFIQPPSRTLAEVCRYQVTRVDLLSPYSAYTL